MKKLGRILGSLLVAVTLLLGSLTVFAADDLESKYGLTEEQVLSAAQQYYAQVAAMSEEELEAAMTDYANDPTLLAFFESWQAIQKDLGAFEQTMDDSLDIEVEEDGFQIDLPIKYENKTIHLIIVCDAQGGIESMLFENEAAAMGLGTIFKKAGLNTVLGMGTVFAVLVLISFIIYLLGVLCGGQPKAEKGPKAEKTVNTAKPVAKETNVEEEMVAAIAAASMAAQSDDKELVAVISAAIAAATGTSTDNFVVRSIRKVKRS